MPTMKDVAREANVSLGTVSNVLNQRPSVSEANREKVMRAVEKLQFRPNTAARTLKTKSSRSIGLIIPDINNPFYPELARGVEDTAKKYGHSILLCNNDRNKEKEREYIDILIEKNVDGIILVKPRIGIAQLQKIREICPVVAVDADYVPEGQFDIINVDDDNGMRLAMELLYEYGHRRIAFISGLLESVSSRSRRQAYIDFLTEKSIPVRPEYIAMGAYNWYSGYTCTVELLRLLTPPTAIFAANDLMAIGAMKAIHERRQKIPLDISVMGYDDIDMASLCTPQLTTIWQPKYEIGVLSVNMLLNHRRSEEIESKQVTLKTEVRLRESVGYANPNS